jgi:hypothetical protein
MPSKRSVSTVLIALVICFLTLDALAGRVNQVGLRNLFNREHCFERDGALTKESAVELSKLVFAADGINVRRLSVCWFSIDDAEHARVDWEDKGGDHERDYDVVIQVRGSRACCRALKTK